MLIKLRVIKAIQHYTQAVKVVNIIATGMKKIVTAITMKTVRVVGQTWTLVMSTSIWVATWEV